jgi:drug/metabolite transporter (DMT)-like permease
MWIVYGLASAIIFAIQYAITKRSTEKFDPVVVSWALIAYSLIVVLPLTLYQGIPSLDSVFWVAISVRTVIESIALVLFVKALQISDMSLSLPVSNLTPLFILFVSYFINGEVPSPIAVLGVIVVVIGTYFLNYTKDMKILDPLRAIYKNKGVFYMLIVAILWSFTSSLHKLAISHSNPYFYTGLGLLLLFLVFMPFVLLFRFEEMKKSLNIKDGRILMVAGLLFGLAILVQNIGQNLSATALYIALTQSKLIFTAIIAAIFFKEKVGGRIIPIIIIMAGIIILTI